MEDLTKYIGLPYGFTDGKYHCVDLCRLFYHDHGFIEDFDDHKPMPISLDDFNQHHKLRLLKYLIRNFDRSDNEDDAEYGDIVLFDILGDMHTGIYLEDGQILAMQVPCNDQAISTIYKHKFWRYAFKYVFKRKKQ